VAVQGIGTLRFANHEGISLCHALAVIIGQKKDIKDFVQPFFTIEYFTNVYAGTIIHPHNIDFAVSLEFNGLGSSDDESDDFEIERTLPPNTNRAPGRPKKRRIRTRTEISEDKPTHVQKSSRCRESGHSVRTCKERI
jgi:hypothetical protein